jgi:hypothetical protein
MKRPKKLESNELQVLGMLAKEHGYTELYQKCCSMMFQNMHLITPLEKTYNNLFKGYKHIALDLGHSEDKANRIANIGAVKNTQKEWRKQHEH